MGASIKTTTKTNLTAMQNTTIQYYQDSNNNWFVKDIPKETIEGLLEMAIEFKKLKDMFHERIGREEVNIKEIAKLLNVSVETIISWKYGVDRNSPLLKEGFHFRKVSERKTLYDVQNMKEFNAALAKEERLREEARQAQEKIYQIEVKLGKRAKRKNK